MRCACTTLTAVSEARSSASRRRVAGLRYVAAAVCGLQALALLGLCVFYLWELVRGGSQEPARVVVSVILIGVFATGLAYLCAAWRTGRRLAVTPTLLWQVLLLPVAWGLLQSGLVLVAVLVGGLALVGLGSALAARPAP